MEAVRWLEEAGLVVNQLEPAPVDGADVDAVIDVAGGKTRALFVVELRRRAPYPNELVRLEEKWKALSRLGNPLLVVPFVPEALGVVLTRAGWSWADGQGDFDLRAPGLVFRQRRAQSVPRHVGRTLPRGSGSFAIIRALIRSGGDEPGATTLAARAGVSQARASQVLHQLQDLRLVDRAERGRWRPDREALLDRFLAEYPGPGGSEAYFYALDPVTNVTVRAAGVLRHELAVSADVGPDLILAWRRPSKVIWYVRRLIAASDLGLVQAQGQHDANVVVRMPKDRSVFPAPPPMAAEAQGAEIGLADPAQMVWDLHDLGGADRIETAEELYKWLLKHP
jgi:hypothetical protein